MQKTLLGTNQIDIKLLKNIKLKNSYFKQFAQIHFPFGARVTLTQL